MTSHDTQPHRGPTPPRGWRPGPRFIAAALFAILLVVVWQLFLGVGPATTIEPVPATQQPRSTLPR